MALSFRCNGQSLYGFNLGPTLNVTNSVDTARSMVRPGLAVEGFYLRQFTPMFYGKLGVGYSLRGYRGKFKELIMPDSVNGDVTRSAWLHYVDIPLMLGITSNDVFMELGGLFSVKLADRAREQYYRSGRGSSTLLYDSVPNLELNSVHISLSLAIGYRLSLKDDLSLRIALRTSMLQKLSGTLKGQYFGLTVGLIFGTPLKQTGHAYDSDEEEEEDTPDVDRPKLNFE